MSIFGQVWLWSVAAFLVGVLLTWLLLVRPVQARSRALERRLRAALATPVPAPPARFFEPEPEHEPYPPLSEPDPFLGQAEPEPEPLERFRVEPDPSERFAPEPEPAVEEPELRWFRKGHNGDGDDGDDGGDKERDERSEPAAREFLGLSSVLEPDRALDTELTSVFQPVDEEPSEDKGSERGTLFGPDDPAPAEFATTDTPEPPAYAFGGGEAPGSDESATETTQVLPRRQPRQSDREGATPPEPPMMRPVERRDPVAPDEGGRSGSLFEPAVRRGVLQAAAVDSAPAPPPARAEKTEKAKKSASSVPPGPFGPGSGMPRPGGGPPSDDFVVKASVTALRYCTENSPHYSRMVAEVWFRTVADAERVGFRPLA